MLSDSRTLRIRAGVDPEPSARVRPSGSATTASRSGLSALVPLASSNVSCPSTGETSRSARPVPDSHTQPWVASSCTTSHPAPYRATPDAARTGVPSANRSGVDDVKVTLMCRIVSGVPPRA